MPKQIIIPTDFEQALERAMPPYLYAALTEARQIAHEFKLPCYLVGGPVRDLLLGHPIDDLDLVFAGDAILVAEQFAARSGGTLVRHAAFGTGKVSFEQAEDLFHVDFITARRETYPYPTSLPVVVPSNLEDDLERRDFTINTLAIQLGTPPQLIDRLAGIPDLEQRLVRVLHDQSFSDDPTRIVRGARFAARLHFVMEPHTAALARRAADAGLIERTTPVRILNEIWLAFREPRPETVFSILHDQGVLAHIFSGLEWRPEIAHAFGQARQMVTKEEVRRLVLLGLSLWWLSEDERRKVLQHYSFSADERRRIAELDVLHTLITDPELERLPLSALDRAFHGLSYTTLLVARIVASSSVKQLIDTYQQLLRPTATLLNGNDLRSLGITPGPRYRTLLEGLRAAQLDGMISNRDQAIRWVHAEQQTRL